MRLADIYDIQVEDFNRLKKDQVKQMLEVTRNAARKRAKRIERSGYGTSIAAHNYKPKNYRNMTTNQMKRELKKDLQFLHDKTSTMAGIKAVHADLEARINETSDTDIKLDPQDLKPYWEAYNKLREDPEVNTKVYAKGSDQLQQMLAREFTKNRNVDPDDLIKSVKEMWVNKYEEAEEKQSEREETFPGNQSMKIVEVEDDDESFEVLP